jgi:hypothetical protein
LQTLQQQNLKLKQFCMTQSNSASFMNLAAQVELKTAEFKHQLGLSEDGEMSSREEDFSA